MSFLIPVFCTLAAGLVLRETVDAARWTATAVGFLGALVIVRPGMESVSLPMLAVILSCAFYAGAWTSVKFLTTTEPASVIVFYMNLMMLPLTLIPSLFVLGHPGLGGFAGAAGDGGFGLDRPFLPGAGLRRGGCERGDAVRFPQAPRIIIPGYSRPFHKAALRP